MAMALDQLLIKDLVAEVDALIAHVHARAGDQLLDLTLRLSAETAKQLLIGIGGTCQRTQLLDRDGRFGGQWISDLPVCRWITPLQACFLPESQNARELAFS
jgi:hypothetical protein